MFWCLCLFSHILALKWSIWWLCVVKAQLFFLFLLASGRTIYSASKHLSMAAPFNVLWAAPPGAPPVFPCVDCGLITGNFCDGAPSVGYDQCFASDRVPREYTIEAGHGGLRTPLCTYCETCFEFCRFCRGVKGCTPPARHNHWSGIPASRSRHFDADQARLATHKEFAAKKASEVDQERQEEDDRSPKSKPTTIGSS